MQRSTVIQKEGGLGQAFWLFCQFVVAIFYEYYTLWQITFSFPTIHAFVYMNICRVNLEAFWWRRDTLLCPVFQMKSDWKGQYFISEAKFQEAACASTSFLLFSNNSMQEVFLQCGSQNGKTHRAELPTSLHQHVTKQEIQVWNFKPLRLLLFVTIAKQIGI